MICPPCLADYFWADLAELEPPPPVEEGVSFVSLLQEASEPAAEEPAAPPPPATPAPPKCADAAAGALARAVSFAGRDGRHAALD